MFYLLTNYSLTGFPLETTPIVNTTPSLRRAGARRPRRGGAEAAQRARQPAGVHPQCRRHRQGHAARRQGPQDGEEETEGAGAR